MRLTNYYCRCFFGCALGSLAVTVSFDILLLSFLFTAKIIDTYQSNLSTATLQPFYSAT